MNSDVESLSYFDPFTHVYSFDKAFTPDLLVHLIKAYNNSKYLNYVVSHQKFSDADDFDFNFLAEISTNMTGMCIVYIFFNFIFIFCICFLFVVSAEKHKAFVYKRKTLRKLSDRLSLTIVLNFLKTFFI